MDVKVFSTAPTKRDAMWQIVLFPTVTILRNREFNESYTVVSAEWLFWSVTKIIHDN